MKCAKCKERESTGIIFDLCDPCFEEFEAKIQRESGSSGKYRPQDPELEYFSDDVVDRSRN